MNYNKESVSLSLAQECLNVIDTDSDTWEENRYDPGTEWMEWYTEYLNQTTQQQNHLLATKWGQGTPWNSKTPVRYGGDHCYTGCTNVAVAQVLYYLHGEIGIPTASPKNGITYKYLSSPADSIVMSMNFAMFDSPT